MLLETLSKLSIAYMKSIPLETIAKSLSKLHTLTLFAWPRTHSSARFGMLSKCLLLETPLTPTQNITIWLKILKTISKNFQEEDTSMSLAMMLLSSMLSQFVTLLSISHLKN